MAIFDKKGIPAPTKKETTSRSFTDTALIPVLPASVMLTHQKRANFIDDLLKFTRLPRKLFDELYLEAIQHFAEFAQRLAAVKGAKYDGLGGALDLSLERARNSLEQYCRYLKDNGIYPPTFSMQQELWSYVIFTASLFYDCGRLAEYYQVKLYDGERNEVAEWLPAKGDMKETGAYYHADKHMLTGPQDYLHEMTVIIARRLIPNKGFEWIVSQRASLETWLQLLASDMDDEEGTRSLFMSLILWVDNYLISGEDPGGGKPPRQTKKYAIPMTHFQRPAEAGMNVRQGYAAGLSAEQGPQSQAPAEGMGQFANAGGPQQYQTPGEAIGQFPNTGGEFLEWLRTGLINGRISYNTAGAMLLFLREGMIFRGTQLYSQFLHDKGLTDKMSVRDVEKAFHQLGLTEGHDVKVQAGNDPKHQQNYTLIPNASSVFPGVKMDTLNFEIIVPPRIVAQNRWYQDVQAQVSPTLPHPHPGGKGK